MLTRIVRLFAIPVIAALVMLPTAPARADGVSCGAGQAYDQRTGTCVVVASAAGEKAPATQSAAQAVGAHRSTSVTAASCREQNDSTGRSEPVPCRSRWGYWSNGRSCYIRPMSPPPAKSSPLWEGHTDGAVYECSRTAGQVTVSVRFWSAEAPAAQAAPPDPAVVARTVVRQMQLRAITIGMVPDDRPDSIGIVGVPAWMWVAAPDPHTFGPLTRTASAGGTSVTATARVSRIVWSMGDGDTVTCRSAGTAFADGDGGSKSPDCGYVYEKEGRYIVRATSFWTVDWTSNSGASGSIPLSFSTSRPLTVAEVQVVRSGGSS